MSSFSIVTYVCAMPNMPSQKFKWTKSPDINPIQILQMFLVKVISTHAQISKGVASSYSACPVGPAGVLNSPIFCFSSMLEVGPSLKGDIYQIKTSFKLIF